MDDTQLLQQTFAVDPTKINEAIAAVQGKGYNPEQFEYLLDVLGTPLDQKIYDKILISLRLRFVTYIEKRTINLADLLERCDKESAKKNGYVDEDLRKQVFDLCEKIRNNLPIFKLLASDNDSANSLAHILYNSGKAYFYLAGYNDKLYDDVALNCVSAAKDLYTDEGEKTLCDELITKIKSFINNQSDFTVPSHESAIKAEPAPKSMLTDLFGDDDLEQYQDKNKAFAFGKTIVSRSGRNSKKRERDGDDHVYVHENEDVEVNGGEDEESENSEDGNWGSRRKKSKLDEQSTNGSETTRTVTSVPKFLRDQDNKSGSYVTNHGNTSFITLELPIEPASNKNRHEETRNSGPMTLKFHHTPSGGATNNGNNHRQNKDGGKGSRTTKTTTTTTITSIDGPISKDDSGSFTQVGNARFCYPFPSPSPDRNNQESKDNPESNPHPINIPVVTPIHVPGVPIIPSSVQPNTSQSSSFSQKNPTGHFFPIISSKSQAEKSQVPQKQSNANSHNQSIEQQISSIKTIANELATKILKNKGNSDTHKELAKYYLDLACLSAKSGDFAEQEKYMAGCKNQTDRAVQLATQEGQNQQNTQTFQFQ